jgi:hypothetical protein
MACASSQERIDDIRRVVDYVKKKIGIPAWLAGASREIVFAISEMTAVRFANPIR